jgi:hypothetical protein
MERMNSMAQRYGFSPIEDVLALYTVTETEEVQDFLEKNPFLIPLVSATYQNIRKYFSYSDVTLDLEIDPEDGTACLAAHVVTSLPFEEAYKQLKQFDWQWWLSVLGQARSKFYVDLD